MTDEEATKYLHESASELLERVERQQIELTFDWVNNIPSKAGLYAIFMGKDSKEPVYVGQTGKLQGRMRDLLDTRNHNLRRSLGKDLFGNTSGFRDASASTRFPDEIEKLVNNKLTSMYVAVLPLQVGRLEVEELIVSHEPKPKYNIKGRRN